MHTMHAYIIYYTFFLFSKASHSTWIMNSWCVCLRLRLLWLWWPCMRNHNAVIGRYRLNSAILPCNHVNVIIINPCFFCAAFAFAFFILFVFVFVVCFIDVVVDLCPLLVDCWLHCPFVQPFPLPALCSALSGRWSPSSSLLYTSRTTSTK